MAALFLVQRCSIGWARAVPLVCTFINPFTSAAR